MRLRLTIKNTENDGANLDIDIDRVIAMEELQKDQATRLYLDTGTVFTVYETMETIEQYKNL